MVKLVVAPLLPLSSPNLRILVVENELKAAELLQKGLSESGYEVHVVHDGEAARKQIMHNDFDLALIDVTIPVINGIALCRMIREKKKDVPVLLLSAMTKTEDKLAGFDAGADDFLTKPFDLRELLARVKALTKRSAAAGANRIRVADLQLDLDRKIAIRGRMKIQLSAKEFTLLEFFMRNAEKVLTREVITEKVWNLGFETNTNVVDVYVNMLRKKIDRNCEPKLIHTKIGMGYYFGVK